MLQYKINVIEALKNKGYTTTRIRREHILPESTLTRIRAGDPGISCASLGTICAMLRCQPGDVMESVVTDQERIKLF